jgi:hypothetical protein
MAGLTITADLRGVEATQRKFSALSRSVRKDVARKSVRAGLKQQLRAAKSSTILRDKSGNLRKSLTTSVRTKRGGDEVIGAVRARKPRKAKSQFYWTGLPLEFGHRIAVSRIGGASKKNYVLDRVGQDRRKRRSNQSVAVSAGFVEPRPFMRRSFLASMEAARAAFTSEFTRSVSNEVARG